VVSQFVKFFGAKAAHPRSYFETNWSREEWTRGCPVAIAGPGTLVAYGPALRRPVGRIHWAGTETSTFWNGYMDGAIRSGERDARGPRPQASRRADRPFADPLGIRAPEARRSQWSCRPRGLSSCS
jgi:hypothetical protein